MSHKNAIPILIAFMVQLGGCASFISSQKVLSRADLGGAEAGNGGGLAEKNVTFAYLNLESFIALCLNSPSSRLDSEEVSLLEQIRDSLPKEMENPSLLIFQRQKDSPDFFKIDGVIRVAKTGDHVGDPIYINTDLLYTPRAGGQYLAMDIPLATSVLIHELGHHHAVRDHARLDVLGSKVQTLLLTDSERSEFWNGNAALLTFQLNHVHSDEQKRSITRVDEVILESGTELYPLTDMILKETSCPKAVSKNKVMGLRIYNLHDERGVQFDKKTELLTKHFRAWFIESCEAGRESEHGDLVIDLTFKKRAQEHFEFLPEKTKILQLSCSDHAEVCK